MAALAWLFIPLLAAFAAAAWGAWAARSRTTGDARSLEGFDRFRETMERSRSGSDTV